MSSEKKRISVTLTKIYIDGLDQLVEEGHYLGRGEIILDALRCLFKIKHISPFYSEAEA